MRKYVNLTCVIYFHRYVSKYSGLFWGTLYACMYVCTYACACVHVKVYTQAKPSNENNMLLHDLNTECWADMSDWNRASETPYCK